MFSFLRQIGVALALIACAAPAAAQSPAQRQIVIAGGKTTPTQRFIASNPADTAGAWLMAEAITTNYRQVVPNLKTLATRPVSPNLMPMPARSFNRANMQNYFGWSGFSAVTDDAATAPNGRTEATTMTASGDWALFTQNVVFPVSGQFTMVLTAKSHDGTAWQFKQKVLSNNQTSAARTLSNSYQRFPFPFNVTAGNETFLEFAISPNGATGVSMDVADVALYPGGADLEPNGRALFGGHIVIGKKPFDSAALFQAGFVDTGTTPTPGMIAWETNEAPSLNGATVVSLSRPVTASTFLGVLSELNNFSDFTAYVRDNSKALNFLAGGVAAKNQTGAGSDPVWSSYWDPLNDWKYVTGRMTAAGVATIFNGRLPLFTRDTKTAMSVSAPALYAFNATNDPSQPSGLQHAALVLVPRGVSNAEQVAMIDAIDARLASTGITPVPPEPVVILADGNSLSTVSGAFPIVAAPSLTGRPPLINFAESGTTLARKRAHLTNTINASLAAVRPGQRLIYQLLEGTNDAYGTGYTGFVNPAHTGQSAFIEDMEWQFASVKAGGINIVTLAGTGPSDTAMNTVRDSFNAYVKANWVQNGKVDALLPLGDDATVGPDAAAADTSLFSDTRHFTALAVNSAVAPADVLALNDLIETTVATPVVTPATGTYNGDQSVTIATSSLNATTYYTTDGSTPTRSSTLYTGAFTLSATATVKALAVKAGKIDSAIGSAAITITANVLPPVFSPGPGQYSSTQSVAMTSGTPGASIYYTTDGSTPDNTKTLYTGAVSIAASRTLKAIAVKAGLNDSTVTTGQFDIFGYATGDQSGNITVTNAAGFFTFDIGTAAKLVDGDTANTFTHFNGTTLDGNQWFRFTWASPQVIDEARLWQSTTNTHGVWQWYGSNDGGTTKTAIGGTFTLTGNTTGSNPMTTLHGNTTGYTTYELRSVSSSTSNSPWIREFQFREKLSWAPAANDNARLRAVA